MDYPINKPVNTRNTTVQVHSVLWCAKNQNCTCTHTTHFGNTMGLPIPALNPIPQLPVIRDLHVVQPPPLISQVLP
jgi:hypothetical protein